MTRKQKQRSKMENFEKEKGLFPRLNRKNDQDSTKLRQCYLQLCVEILEDVATRMIGSSNSEA
jgi:uncharacterized protein YutE (UPF0331/DUF86 family)